MIFFYSFIILTLINLTRLIFWDVYLWQRKEYRLDRILSFFHAVEGKRFLLNPIVSLKWILLISGLISYYPFAYLLSALVTITLTIDLFKGIQNFKRPKLSFRSLSLIILSAIVLILLFQLISIPFVLSALVIDRLLFFIISLGVLLTSIPSFLYIKYQAYKAHKKIESYPNLIVIGITGSFGKTTTKEFLASILSQKYRVLKTAGTNNTEIGIANTILGKLTPYIQIFIVEMGAYKRGEIKTLCNLVSPSMGVLTGINSEHIELFGSIENTMKAKYELAEGLTQNGMIFLNGSSKPLHQMSSWIEKDRKDLKKFWYGEVPPQDKKNNVDVKNIKSELGSLSFEICWNGECLGCKTTFGGKQFIQNISGAASVALQLGLSLAEIQRGISNLSLPHNRMKLMKFGKVYIVDDTYNSNPDGVLTGLNYLSQFHGKKWFVFSPIIELNKEGKLIHQKISKQAENICDRIFLTNSNYSKEFLENEKDKVYAINKQKQLDSYVVDKTKDIMIYFSGREAKRQMELVLRKIK